MYIIAPLSSCASAPKRDRVRQATIQSLMMKIITKQFLEYISKIAAVTHAREPKCPAYAWFRSAEDNDAVPHHWVRGLEVYAHLVYLTLVILPW